MSKRRKGDCAQVALRLLDERPFSPDAVLCHGWPIGRGKENSGKRFFHAWVEDEGVAYDYSNGLSVEIPVDLYYAIGNIEAQHVQRYSQDAAWAQIRIFSHMGPWAPVPWKYEDVLV